jgi:alkylation response protein AidB-like acyl-CoA dehydrogenase
MTVMALEEPGSREPLDICLKSPAVRCSSRTRLPRAKFAPCTPTARAGAAGGLAVNLVSGEYGVERKWRECRMYQVAPVSTNLILSHVAQHVLGLERSY